VRGAGRRRLDLHGPAGGKARRCRASNGCICPVASRHHQALAETNYLQAIEGGIDSSHVSFLHRGDLATDPFHRNTVGAKLAKSTKTTFHIVDSPGGLIIGARRDADPATITADHAVDHAVVHLIPPYAGNALNGHGGCHGRRKLRGVVDDVSSHPSIPKEHIELIKDGNGVHAELIPGTFRPVANRDNDYLIDRAKQKSGRHYNGVKGLAMQDASVQESMGPSRTGPRSICAPPTAPSSSRASGW